jgi:predicted ribosomally synthesized peptide with SipW-like signal peptide
MSTKARTATTARKIVGSLGVIGAAAAVAGLGTFGAFTDTTTPISTQVQSGKVDINLSETTALTATATGLVPGDTMTRAVTLRNDGDTALSSVSLEVTAPVSSVLTTDKVNGLQLVLKSCTVPWTPGGTAQAPTFACGNGGTERVITTSGAAVGNFLLTGPNSLNPAGVDHLVYTITLPASADNTFQDKKATLELKFSAVQRAASTR